MPLRTVGDIIAEQGRIYRLKVNQRISTNEMVAMVGVLREIRSSIESLPIEPVTMPSTEIVIHSVPSGFSFDVESGQTRPFDYIEHQAIEAPLAIEPPADESTSELAGLADELRAAIRVLSNER
jgi:hypothetical protein